MDESELVQVTVLSVASPGLTVATSRVVCISSRVTEVTSSATETTATVPLNTVTSHLADFPPHDAVIVDVPNATAVTRPEEETVATDCREDAQTILVSVALVGVTIACN